MPYDSCGATDDAHTGRRASWSALFFGVRLEQVAFGAVQDMHLLPRTMYGM